MGKITKEAIFYWTIVGLCFLVILFTVRHIANNARIFVDRDTRINLTTIKWNITITITEDSILRIEDPVYLRKNYYFLPDSEASFKELQIQNDSLYSELALTKPNKGSILNVAPPYLLWKKINSDTIHLVKDNVHLKFLKDDRH